MQKLVVTDPIERVHWHMSSYILFFSFLFFFQNARDVFNKHNITTIYIFPSHIA